MRRQTRKNGRVAEVGGGIDFEAEGLLDGVEGEARTARFDLLERLFGEGVPLEELREAVAAGRLTLLPVERGIAGDGPRYTRDEVAELSGADLGLLQRASAALGIPYPDAGEKVLTEADLGAARRVKAFSTPAFRRTGSFRWRGRSGWGPPGLPTPTAS
jgi:adenylate cyclase